MIKSTWQEEPQERPSFADIVQFLHMIDDPLDERDIFVESAHGSGYLRVNVL